MEITFYESISSSAHNTTYLEQNQKTNTHNLHKQHTSSECFGLSSAKDICDTLNKKKINDNIWNSSSTNKQRTSFIWQANICNKQLPNNHLTTEPNSLFYNNNIFEHQNYKHIPPLQHQICKFTTLNGIKLITKRKWIYWNISYSIYTRIITIADAPHNTILVTVFDFKKEEIYKLSDKELISGKTPNINNNIISRMINSNWYTSAYVNYSDIFRHQS